MTRTLVVLDACNYYAYADGTVTEERVRRKPRRFRRDQWPVPTIAVQYEVPVDDPELIDRVRREVVRLQNLGRTTTPAPRQLPA